MRAISYAAQDRLLKASATANTSSTDPYRTPIASPASMRPKREFASKGKPSPEKPDAEVKMAPPPPRKRGPATVGMRQQQAAVAHSPWAAPEALPSAAQRPGFPSLPQPGHTAGWQMPRKFGTRQQAVAAAASAASGSPTSATRQHAVYMSPRTEPHAAEPHQHRKSRSRQLGERRTCGSGSSGDAEGACLPITPTQAQTPTPYPTHTPSPHYHPRRHPVPHPHPGG